MKERGGDSYASCLSQLELSLNCHPSWRSVRAALAAGNCESLPLQASGGLSSTSRRCRHDEGINHVHRDVSFPPNRTFLDDP
jgi:hypothetical protein